MATLLDKELIRAQLEQPDELALELFESTTSTNDHLKQLSQVKPFTQTHICLAEQQTQGRGRFNRPWISPFAENIYLSLGIPLAQPIDKLEGITIVAALSLTHSLASFNLGEDLKIKWPNDLLFKGNKLAGILVEAGHTTATHTDLILGIGLNVNSIEDPSHTINRAWTSLRLATDKIIDRAQLSAVIINNLLNDIRRFNEGGLNTFLPQWPAKDYLYREVIEIKIHDAILTGTALGINVHGHLLVQDAQGNLHRCQAGEATLKI